MKKGTYLVIILFRKDNETVVAVNRMSHGHDYVFRNAAFKNDFSVGATVDEIKKQESKLFSKSELKDKFNYGVLSLPV